MGCSFNCVYCYIHGSKYGEHIPSQLTAKINAPEILYRQLKNRARKKEHGIIALGSATDPYLPQEENLKITRELLKIIHRFHFPLNLFTKSTLIFRDLEILKKIDNSAHLPPDLMPHLKQGVIISFSFSTVNEKIAAIFEPDAPSPWERLETMQKFKEEGFLTGACLMPLLPFISDSEDQLDIMIKSVKEYGGDFVIPGALTLFGDKPHDCRVRYYEVLEEYFPELIPKTRSIFKSKSYPSSKYQIKIYNMVADISKKHRIRNKIISE
ncbi:MAG: radical SAM protein [Euryarchaeota archaeon]